MSERWWGRFDDLQAGRAVQIVADQVVTAWHADDVVPVLEEVQARTDAGEWAFGYVAYEAASGLDPALQTLPPMEGLPLVWFGFAREAHIVPPVTPAGDLDGVTLPDSQAQQIFGEWTYEWDSNEHARGVRRVRDAIAAGNTDQVNLTCRATAPMKASGLASLQSAYARLAAAQNGRYNAFLHTDRFTVIGASPELFVEWGSREKKDILTMRPMKGTARRGRSTAEDAQAIDYLLGSEKERAENMMIADSVRNELQRVSAPGSVHVTELLTAERYPTVIQLTSTVTGELRAETGLVDIFRSLFPCASVTGAPKASTMQIIADVEGSARGVYCGAVGLMTPLGQSLVPYRAQFNVPIRTVLVDRESGVATYGAGGGITYQSDPAAEWLELQTKTAVLDTSPQRFHLIETMRAHQGAVQHLDHHLARLADSADYCGFSYDDAAVRAAISGAVSSATTPNNTCKVRLTLQRDGQIDVTTGPAPSYHRLPDVPPSKPDADELNHAIRIEIDDHAVDSRDWRRQHKTSMRQMLVDAKNRHPHADEVLLTNEHGQITEGTVTNVVALIDGRWVTAPIKDGLLPGVGRAVLIERGVVSERPVTVDEVHRAEALAVVNALRGWRWAKLLPNGD
ncbi:MAG: bifunctional anthranilate synthase component I family protein/class IV aminotransferase [Arcanobacterium sp.]